MQLLVEPAPRLANPIDPVVKEQQRLEYLDRKSPKRYAEALLALLNDAQDSRRAAGLDAQVPTPPRPRHGALAVLALMALLGGVSVVLTMVTQLRYYLASGRLLHLAGADKGPIWESPSALEFLNRDMVLEQ